MNRRPDGVTESVRIRTHPGLCAAWGNCHRWAPDLYLLDDDGRIDVHLLEVSPRQAIQAWMGAEACPARAISVAITSVEHPSTTTEETTA